MSQRGTSVLLPLGPPTAMVDLPTDDGPRIQSAIGTARSAAASSKFAAVLGTPHTANAPWPWPGDAAFLRRQRPWPRRRTALPMLLSSERMPLYHPRETPQGRAVRRWRKQSGTPARHSTQLTYR